MTSVCFYFQIHQPFRLKNYDFFKIGVDHFYEDDEANRQALNRIANRCYIPANNVLLDLIHRYKSKFRVAFSISGTAIEQLEKHRPDVIESFRRLAATNCVEFIAQPYYNSLSFCYSAGEFEKQVQRHVNKTQELFGKKPEVFKNTELIYNNNVAQAAANMGFKGILCEGVEKWLNGRSTNMLYTPKGTNAIKCLLRNSRLSDDIALRFSNARWAEYPMSAQKFAQWVHKNTGSTCVNLFMDYETFGEYQLAETGIFGFLEQLPNAIFKHTSFDFKTPSEIIESNEQATIEEYDVPQFTSWADNDKSLAAWLDNSMQKEAMERIYKLEERIAAKNHRDFNNVWGKLQTADHFAYMSTRNWNDGEVASRPYSSPYDAYINYMNVLSDLERTL